MTAGQRIYNRRKELGISIEEIAEKVGVSPSTIFRYESGDIAKIPVNTLYLIADALNVSPDFLLSEQDALKQQCTLGTNNDAYILNQLCLRPELRELMDLALKADTREVRKIIRMAELMREK